MEMQTLLERHARWRNFVLSMPSAGGQAMSYECPHCDTTTQWSCDCWQYEAATYRHGAAAGQDHLDQLRREWQRERGPRGSRR
jgi:hypothetical protein